MQKIHPAGAHQTHQDGELFLCFGFLRSQVFHMCLQDVFILFSSITVIL